MQLKCRNDKSMSQAGIPGRIPVFIFLLLLSSLVTKGADLYWIGASGNWSDINHWSLTSGNSGGQLSPSIPQAGDQVIFDRNSGFTANSKTVTINQESSCLTLTVKGVSAPPVFIGNVLNIYGSADFQTGTVLDNTIYFRSGGTSTVDFNEEVNGSAAIYFLGPGTYTISGTLNSTGKMYFLKGTLDFGSSRITTNFFDEAGCCGTVPFAVVEPRSLSLGSSIITLLDRNSQLSGSPSWNYTGTSLTAGTSQINIAKGADDGYAVSFRGKNGHLYHNVSFTSTTNPLNTSAYGWYQIAEGNCTFKTLNFMNSGFINANCTIDTLNLARSKTYYVYGTQNISVINNPTSSCEPLWTFSGYGGIPTTIKSIKGLNLQNARLNYLKALGSQLNSVNNGIDGGQNTGWVFMNTPKNLYWIGGGGNWNDTSHWTTNSDGTPSGGCRPTRSDNVFFTRFSGKISLADPVIVNSDDAECNSISWNSVEGNPVLKTSTQRDVLSIFGSSTWQKGMHYEIATTKYQSSSSGNTITSNGVTIQGNTEFLSDGEWMLNDAFLSPENDLIFRKGHLNTNNQPVTILNLGPTNSGLGVRTLTLGNSMITVNGNWSYIQYGGPAINLNAGTGQINLTAKNANFYYNSGLAYHNVSFTDRGSAKLFSTLYSTSNVCTFNSLTFAGNGFINAGGEPTPISITYLKLYASKKYVLGTNMEIKASDLSVNGPACDGLLEIGSYLRGTRARLNLVNAATIIGAKISDLNIIGSTLTVTGGVDGGNNQNVTITPATSRNFYWIGGSGNWSDPAHWTNNEDGTTDPMNFCLPSAIDHVFFNRYSGRDYTVTLDIHANCNSMTWEEIAGSIPVLKGLLSNPLSINGSLTLQTGMIYDVERTNFVSTTTGNTIMTHGVTMGYSAANISNKGVFFNNTSGKWLLSDTFNVKNFGVINGTFDTNNQSVNAENYESDYVPEGMNPILNLGSSEINIAGYWDGSAIKILNAGTSKINMLGKMPSSNSSGGGVNNNEFRSRAGLVYNNLNFLNEALPGRIIGYDSTTGNNFNNVNFAGESSINGSNQFGTITLGNGKNTHVMAGSTQTISQLISNSTCGSWDFDNGNAALQATITCSSNINFNHARVSGIAITGGASYKVNGVDMGNNSGWTFSSPLAQNLYWIGGSGNWNDPNHWTANTDGTPSGACVPTRDDNVFFTQHSGESPVINIAGIAEFHDMTWNNVTGSPLIGGTINCYGSITLQYSLTHIGGIKFLSSEKGNTITTGGAVVSNNFDINFSGSGSYTLLDDFTTNTRIYFTNGTLNTNGKTIRALSFTGAETNLKQGQPLSLLLGASNIYLTSGGEGWSYTGSHLDAGTSHIYLTQSANYFKGKDGSVYHAITFDSNNNLSNQLLGGITMDKLVFSSKNSTYQLEAGKTITVIDRLQMSGTNCATVQVQSTIPGTQANLCVKGGNITFNFVYLKDISASCLPLTILPQSTDGGNTANINFSPSSVTGIGALGPDIKICAANLPVILDGSAFMPSENTAIQWTNLTTGEVLGTGIKQTITSGGMYRIKVVYGPNCEVSDDITINIDPVIDLVTQIKITQPTCVVPNGEISMIPAKGILYSVDGGTFSSTDYYQLSSGQHTVIAKNEAGCLSYPLIVTIDPRPLMPTANISYGNSDFQATGTVNVVHTGQKGGIYTAFPLGLVIDNTTGTIDLGKSIPNQSYVVTYTFGSGSCSASCTTAVKINSTPATIAYPLMDYCAVGTVKIKQTGPQNGKYISIHSGLKMDEETGAINLAESDPGIYLVTYTYQDGSIQSIANTTITINALPLVTIISDLGTEITKGQTITLTASGGVNYAWIGTDIQSGQNTSIIKVCPKETSAYTVIATNAEGCSNVREIIVKVKKDQSLVPNNVITPNGDGKNDTWVIKNIDQYPNNKVSIYDRAGRLVYSKTGYTNNWDGIWNGKQLNEDAYIYVIEPGNGKRMIRGTVSIIRDQP